MNPTVVRPSGQIPAPRAAADDGPASGPRPAGAASPAVAYQRVLHRMVRRELRLVAELAAWAPPGEKHRIAALTRHAELIGRVLLHHHTVEREAVWPALLRAAPAAREAVEGWTVRWMWIDAMVRDVATAARQWQVTGTSAAQTTCASACLVLADAVEGQTAEEERLLLPLLGRHLAAEEWAAIAASSHLRLSGPEQLLVLGLTLEDCCPDDRARLLAGLPWSVRAAWRVYGARHYRAAVVRLRGAPPAG